MISPIHCTWKYTTRCASWSNADASAAPKSAGGTCTRRSILLSIAGSCGQQQLDNRFLLWPMRVLWKFLRMNSKPPSCSSIAYLTSNSGVFTLGLESIKLGHGGDTLLADFLNLDAHTVARGRQQLLDHDVASGRTRRQGGGRIPTEKKRPK